MKYFVSILLIICMLAVTAQALSPAAMDNSLIKLGDGCGGSVNERVSCDDFSDCSWKCDAQTGNAIKVCKEMHGYCSTGGSECVPCDFIKFDSNAEYKCTSETITKPANYDLLGTEQCIDATTKTVVRTEISCEDGVFKNVDLVVETNTIPSCNAATTNLNEYWAYDYDGDGYYSEITTERTTMPPENCEWTYVIQTTVSNSEYYRIKNCQSDHSKYWRRASLTSGWESGCEDLKTITNQADFDDAFLRCASESSDSQITPNTNFCEDEDNDLYGHECELSANLDDDETYGSSATYKAIHKLKHPLSDMKDNGINAENINRYFEVENNDDDNYYGKVFLSSSQTTTHNTPTSNKYDCNDDRFDDPTNPSKEGCYCDSSQINDRLSITYEICSDVESSATINPDSTTSTSEFTLNRNINKYQWVSASSRRTPKNQYASCPNHLCPYVKSAGASCAETGTIAGDNKQGSGNYPVIGAGDLICEIDSEGVANWQSRTAKAMTALTLIGENSDNDYTVYCDSVKELIQNDNSKIEELVYPSVFSYIKEIQDNRLDDNQIKGCVLAINGDDSEGYVKKLISGEGFTQDDQKLIYAFPIGKQIPSPATGVNDNKGYFGILETIANVDQTTLEGIAIGAEETTYYHVETKTLFILQAKDDSTREVDGDLRGWFEESMDPNKFTFNIIDFIKSPFTFLANKITDTTKKATINSIVSSLDRFDKLYIGKNNNFYIFSVLEEHVSGKQLVARILNPQEDDENPGDGFKTYLAKMCYNTANEFSITCTFEENTISNENVEPYLSNPSLASRDKLSNDILLQSTTFNEEDWDKWTKALRLQNNTESDSNNAFFNAQCSDAIACSDTVDDCFTPSCIAGVCVNNPIEDCNIVDVTEVEEGTIPTTYQPTEPSVFSAIITGTNTCGLGRTTLVELSSTTNAHVQIPSDGVDYDFKVCIPDTFAVSYENAGCAAGSTEVLSLTSQLNAHAIAPGENVPDSVAVCVNAELNCEMKESCSQEESVLSLSTLQNAHAANPDSTPYPGTNNVICCNLVEPETV